MAWPTKTDFVDGDVLTAAQVNNIGTNLNVFNPTSATNGQIWVANGSGSGSYQTPSGGWTLINSGTLSGSTITSSTFSGYKQLHIDITQARHNALDFLALRLNGITTASYGYWNIDNPSSTTARIQWSKNDFQMNQSYTLLNNEFYSMGIDVYNTDTALALKTARATQITTIAAANKDSLCNSFANISAAITSVTIMLPGGATWNSGSYYIYGLK